MIGTYYAIKHKIDDEIVLEGIIRNTEDTIYPQQETGIEELPYECEAHHFRSENYKIEMCNFVITRDFVRKNRTTGDKI